MKIEVEALGPVGDLIEKESMEISLLYNETYKELQREEPMRKIRYVLNIGNYSYFIRPNGELELI